MILGEPCSLSISLYNNSKDDKAKIIAQYIKGMSITQEQHHLWC